MKYPQLLCNSIILVRERVDPRGIEPLACYYPIFSLAVLPTELRAHIFSQLFVNTVVIYYFKNL